MDRSDYLNEILPIAAQKKNLLIQWPTGSGKSRCALEIVKENILNHNLFPDILIVIPKVVLINNWKDEIKKWLGSEELDAFTFTTYVSFFKHMDKKWDAIIFDECHHFTDRCKEAFQPALADRVIALSATVRREPKRRLCESIPDLWFHRISARKAIDDAVLPDPHVFLIPLDLSKVKGEFIYTKNPKGVGSFRVSYEGRWPYIKRNERIDIVCTAQQCHSLFCNDVEYWEKRFKRFQNPWERNKWLRAAGERLKWLSNIKTGLVKDILKQLSECRTLTFCSSIEQAEELGSNTIHSKTKEGVNNLRKFNEGVENHITSVNVLNEGMNLTSCQVGIFAGLTASETAQLQKLGRLLRHKKPLLILPYFINTRDEEIVNEMKINYNPSLVKIVAPDKISKEIKTFLSNETGN